MNYSGGIIFINISDEEAANLKKICDEIFGESNFCADIVWNSTKSVTNTALISVSHTHTLVYFKSKEYYVKNRIEFRLPDDGEGFSNPDNDPKGPWKADPFQVGGWRPNQQYEITNPNTGKVYTPNEGSSWKNDFKTFQRIYDEGRIVFGVDGTAGPMRKRYLSEAKDRGKVAKTWWDDTETTTNGTTQLKKIFDNKKYFDNPKPIGLLKRIIQLGTTSDDNEIILDFFAGSSTTAHATMELNAEDGGNRQFIMVQLPEPLKENDVAYKDGYKNLSEISQERIRRAGEEIIKDNQLFEENLDTGFKVFKLDTSNIRKWNVNSENIEESLFAMENNFVEGRSHADIIYEVLLKLGLDLNIPFEENTIEGSTVYDVAFGNVYVVLGENITQEVANYISDKQKDYENENPSVVFNDNGFKDDNEKLNSIEILKNNGFNEEQLMSI